MERTFLWFLKKNEGRREGGDREGSEDVRR